MMSKEPLISSTFAGSMLKNLSPAAVATSTGSSSPNGDFMICAGRIATKPAAEGATYFVSIGVDAAADFGFGSGVVACCCAHTSNEGPIAMEAAKARQIQLRLDAARKGKTGVISASFEMECGQ